MKKLERDVKLNKKKKKKKKKGQKGVHFLKVKVIEVKGQISVSRSSRSKVKFLYLGSPWSKVIEYRGQRSNLCFFFLFPPRSLGRSSPNLEGRWRAAPDISLRGSFFERSRSSRSKVKFMGFFSVCSPTSPRS